MSDASPPPGPDDRNRYNDHWQARRRGGRWGEGGGWFGGILLIFIGGFFLLRNFGVDMPDNWWAVFILIPAFGAFSAAWSMYRRSGELTSGAIGAAAGGVFLVLLALAFFIGLDIGKYWPVILIVLGAGALLSNLRRR